MGLETGVHTKQEVVKEWKRILKLKTKKLACPSPWIVEFPDTPQELDVFAEAYHEDPPVTEPPSTLGHAVALNGSMRRKKSSGAIVPLTQPSASAAAPGMDAMTQQMQMMMGGMNNMFQTFSRLLSGEPQIQFMNRGHGDEGGRGRSEPSVVKTDASMPPAPHTQVEVMQKALAARRTERQGDGRKRTGAVDAGGKKDSPEKRAKDAPAANQHAENPKEQGSASASSSEGGTKGAKQKETKPTRKQAKKPAETAERRGSGSEVKPKASPKQPAKAAGAVREGKKYCTKKHGRATFTAWAIHNNQTKKQIVQMTTNACENADEKVKEITEKLNQGACSEAEAIAAVNAFKSTA